MYSKSCQLKLFHHRKTDHTEWMVPHSFIWIPDMVVSQGPTPAARPSGWTLSWPGEPCLSAASWLVLLYLTSISCNKAGRGVNGFGSFCRINNGCALRDAPSNKLGCRAETRQHRKLRWSGSSVKKERFIQRLTLLNRKISRYISD
jgi:hypothetical protein